MTIDQPTVAALSIIAEIENPVFARACLIAYLFLRTSGLSICEVPPHELARRLRIDDPMLMGQWLADAWDRVGSWSRAWGDIERNGLDDCTITLGLNP